MFTGIIESLGRITSVEPFQSASAASAAPGAVGDTRMSFVADGDYLDGIQLGDSIAIMGVCLTANVLIPGGFVADLSAETLNLTTARDWQVGQRVNLERALTANKPLGGHFVSGHVDGVGQLVTKFEEARSWRMDFRAPHELARYIARKGSITINGVSLTVNSVEGDVFGVNLIPHTYEHTTLGLLEAGAAVNLEVDLVARYLERLLAAREAPSA